MLSLYEPKRKSKIPKKAELLTENESLRADKAALVDEVAECHDVIRDLERDNLELRYRLSLREVAQ